MPGTEISEVTLVVRGGGQFEIAFKGEGDATTVVMPAATAEALRAKLEDVLRGLSSNPASP